MFASRQAITRATGRDVAELAVTLAPTMSEDQRSVMV